MQTVQQLNQRVKELEAQVATLISLLAEARQRNLPPPAQRVPWPEPEWVSPKGLTDGFIY